MKKVVMVVALIGCFSPFGAAFCEDPVTDESKVSESKADESASNGEHNRLPEETTEDSATK